MIKKRKNFLGGVILASAILKLLEFAFTGCMTLPQLPRLCREEAQGYILGNILLLICGIFILFKGVRPTGKDDEGK